MIPEESKETQTLRTEMQKSDLNSMLESVLETYVKILNASMFKKSKQTREEHGDAMYRLSIAVNMLVAGGATCPRFSGIINDLNPKEFLGRFLGSIPASW